MPDFLRDIPRRSDQLTPFLPAGPSVVVEEIRHLVDPVQAGLIAAHVTLCREHELEAIADIEVQTRLRAWTHGPLTMTFYASTSATASTSRITIGTYPAPDGRPCLPSWLNQIARMP